MAKSEPMETLKDAGRNFLEALGERAMSTVSDKVGDLTDKLQDVAGGGPVGKAVAKGGEEKAEGGSAVMGALKGAASGVKDKITGGGGGSGGKATKATNIVETIDVGVPVSVAYNQWTEFGEFPSFMKKVETVEAEDETKLMFKAQIFLSHRTWEATIIEQVPDERIVWRSKGEKGHVDGAVTFHEIGPDLTRILVVLEYYPQGFFEKTGNIWEAQGRRARAELRHFRRHVMTRTLLHPDEVEGWRGEIRDGEVVKSHDEAMQEAEESEDAEEQEDEYGEESEQEPAEEDDEAEDEYEDEADDEYEPAEDEVGDEPEDEDEEYEEEPAEGEEEPDEDAEDEYEEEPAEDEEEPEDDAEDEYDEEPAEDEEEPEDEEPEDEEPEDEPAEDEYEEEPAEDEEEPEERPRRRRKAS